MNLCMRAKYDPVRPSCSVADLAAFAPEISAGLSASGADFALSSGAKFLFLCLCASAAALPHAARAAALVAVDALAYLALYPAALALAHDSALVVSARETPRKIPGSNSSSGAVRRLKVALLAVLLGGNSIGFLAQISARKQA